MVMEVLDISLKRPSIHPPTIIMSIKVSTVYIVIVSYFMVLVTMVFIMMRVLEFLWVAEEVDLGLKILATLTLRNCGVHCCGDKSGDDGRGRFWSQDTSHY